MGFFGLKRFLIKIRICQDLKILRYARRRQQAFFYSPYSANIHILIIRRSGLRLITGSEQNHRDLSVSHQSDTTSKALWR